MMRRNYHIKQRNAWDAPGAFLFGNPLKKGVLLLIIWLCFLCFPEPILHISPILPDIPPSVEVLDEISSVFEPFPFPEQLNVQVDFWKKVFTQYTTKQAIIHDDWYVNVIYEVVDVTSPDFSNDVEGWKAAKKRKDWYEKQLANMSRHWGDRKNMSAEEERLYDLFKDIPESSSFKQKNAASRVRIQVGQADRFKEGIIRAGQYLFAMKQIFAEYELPEKLVYLPLIESAFNPFATSFVGAGGMWQFMEGTAKQYNLRMNHIVDERRDPLRATRAAAELLSHNYSSTQSWPLAITAYNFGLQGIKNAAKDVGSEDITTIIEKYKGKRFGFASRNFYVEFLAAVDVCLRYTEYFGEIEMQAPLELVQITLPDYVEARILSKYTSFSIEDLKNLNPALHTSVFTRGNFLPREYTLNIPAHQKDSFESDYASIPSSLRYDYLPVKATHRVQKNQTLSEIAALYDTSVKAIMKINGIRNPRRVQAGQKLKIPGGYVTLAKQTASLSSIASQDSSSHIHTVKKRQTLITIAKIYGTSAQAIAELNGIKNPRTLKAGHRLKIPERSRVVTADSSTADKEKEHRVQKGQTLEVIAKLHNSSVKAITRANAIKNPRRLQIGQVLKIPYIPEG